MLAPRVQRLPTIDQWNATIQRQLTPTLNVTRQLYRQQGNSRFFAGGGPSYNSNQPAAGAGAAPYSLHPQRRHLNGGNLRLQAKLSRHFSPRGARRPLFLNGVPAFTYPGFYLC